jgi:hypothetical protein
VLDLAEVVGFSAIERDGSAATAAAVTVDFRNSRLVVSMGQKQSWNSFSKSRSHGRPKECSHDFESGIPSVGTIAAAQELIALFRKAA